MQFNIKLKKLFPYISLALNIIGIGLIVFLIFTRLSASYGGENIYASADLISKLPFKNLSMVVLILAIVKVCATIASALLLFIKKKDIALWIDSGIGIIFGLGIFIIQGYIRMFRNLSLILAGAILLVSLASFVILLFVEREHKELSEEEMLKNNKITNAQKFLLLFFNVLAIAAIAVVFFVPLYSQVVDGVKIQYVLTDALSSKRTLFIYIAFISFVIALLGAFLYFVRCLSSFFRSPHEFVKTSKFVMYLSTGLTLVFFLVGYIYSYAISTAAKPASTISFIPLLISVLLLIPYSVIWGKTAPIDENREKVHKDGRRWIRLEALVFCTILAGIVVFSNFLDMAKVKFNFIGYSQSVRISGFDLIFQPAKYGDGFRPLTFLIFVELIIVGSLLVTTFVAYFSKFKYYSLIVKLSSISNVIMLFMVGVFGFYYQIVQSLNEGTIVALLNFLGVTSIDTESYKYSVQSQTIYAFAASLVVLFIMIIRGQLSFGPMKQLVADLSPVGGPSSDGTDNYGDKKEDEKKDIGDKPKLVSMSFDACPAFTELDLKKPGFDEDLATRESSPFSGSTLPELVNFVVDYARRSRLHLSYSAEDIATFVAGLGTSRLSILQGMSGTGKTSLPKIFIEAIRGNVDIIEVESSWRDKNELIGYYNEFSKSFTPKKFTQALYKARLNPSIPTFMVLDEMNLSRIEYYFSDFLSLMENEEDKREIKLLNVKLKRIEEGEEYQYLGLSEGHTLKIPTNVWFIGTANRDESTFDISDKVYDRAQTMNFNKRAPKIVENGEPLKPSFLSYIRFKDMFTHALSSVEFNAEKNQLIIDCEKLLLPYNISFGNRVLNQIESFVKIYCACFGNKSGVESDAVERILLSKVVAKLETKNVDDKEELASAFDEANLHRCAEFIRKLNED